MAKGVHTWSSKSIHHPPWQIFKVLHPWALFREATIHTNTCTHAHPLTFTHVSMHTLTHTCHIHTGLAGSKDIENAQIWGFVDETSDLLEKAYKPYFEKDEAKKVCTVVSRKYAPPFATLASVQNAGGAYTQDATISLAITPSLPVPVKHDLTVCGVWGPSARHRRA